VLSCAEAVSACEQLRALQADDEEVLCRQPLVVQLSREGQGLIQMGKGFLQIAEFLVGGSDVEKVLGGAFLILSSVGSLG